MIEMVYLLWYIYLRSQEYGGYYISTYKFKLNSGSLLIDAKLLIVDRLRWWERIISCTP